MKFIHSLILGLFLFICLAAAEPARPHAGFSPLQARQRHTAELKARAQHPDLFRKRDNPAPSSSPSCPLRRGLDDGTLQILRPEEAAAFLMGRGKFSAPNGTFYHDPHYIYALEKDVHTGKAFYHKVYNVVKDNLGNKLLEISIPHYKKWKNTLVPGQMFHLSPLTAIRVDDLEKLEDLLLANPDFEDIQFWNFRINRRFFEVSRLY